MPQFLLRQQEQNSHGHLMLQSLGGDILLATWAVKGYLLSADRLHTLEGNQGSGSKCRLSKYRLDLFPTPVTLWLCLTIAKSLNL